MWIPEGKNVEINDHILVKFDLFYCLLDSTFGLPKLTKTSNTNNTVANESTQNDGKTHNLANSTQTVNSLISSASAFAASTNVNTKIPHIGSATATPKSQLKSPIIQFGGTSTAIKPAIAVNKQPTTTINTTSASSLCNGSKTTRSNLVTPTRKSQPPPQSQSQLQVQTHQVQVRSKLSTFQQSQASNIVRVSPFNTNTQTPSHNNTPSRQPLKDHENNTVQPVESSSHKKVLRFSDNIDPDHLFDDDFGDLDDDDDVDEINLDENDEEFQKFLNTELSDEKYEENFSLFVYFLGF